MLEYQPWEQDQRAVVVAVAAAVVVSAVACVAADIPVAVEEQADWVLQLAVAVYTAHLR